MLHTLNLQVLHDNSTSIKLEKQILDVIRRDYILLAAKIQILTVG